MFGTNHLTSRSSLFPKLWARRNNLSRKTTLNLSTLNFFASKPHATVNLFLFAIIILKKGAFLYMVLKVFLLGQFILALVFFLVTVGPQDCISKSLDSCMCAVQFVHFSSSRWMSTFSFLSGLLFRFLKTHLHSALNGASSTLWRFISPCMSKG